MTTGCNPVEQPAEVAQADRMVELAGYILNLRAVVIAVGTKHEAIVNATEDVMRGVWQAELPSEREDAIGKLLDVIDNTLACKPSKVDRDCMGSVISAIEKIVERTCG